MGSSVPWWSGREARQRTANPCTRVQIPSPPRAIGAVVARFLDTEEVTGSNPVSPTSTHKPLSHSWLRGFFVPRTSGDSVEAELVALDVLQRDAGFVLLVGVL